MLPTCSLRGEIRGDMCQCHSNRINHMIPGMAPLALCAICHVINVPSYVPEFSCVHRGDPTRREECHTCGIRGVVVDVLSCDLFDECTIHAHGLRLNGGKMPVCVGCERRETKT